MKGVVAAVVGLSMVLLLAGCSDSSSETKSTNSCSVEEVSSSSEEESSVESSESKTDYDPEPSLDIKIETSRSALQESFAQYGVVRYDKSIKSFILTPTNAGLLEEIEGTVAGTYAPDSWSGLVDSAIDLSNSITDLLGTGYIFAIENPYETGQEILIISDGVVTHDAVAEQVCFKYEN